MCSRPSQKPRRLRSTCLSALQPQSDFPRCCLREMSAKTRSSLPHPWQHAERAISQSFARERARRTELSRQSDTPEQQVSKMWEQRLAFAFSYRMPSPSNRRLYSTLRPYLSPFPAFDSFSERGCRTLRSAASNHRQCPALAFGIMPFLGPWSAPSLFDSADKDGCRLRSWEGRRKMARENVRRGSEAAPRVTPLRTGHHALT